MEDRRPPVFSLLGYFWRCRFVGQEGSALGTVGGGEHGVYEHRRVDLEGHVVDGLALDTGGLGYLLEVFAGHVFESYVFDGEREADLQAEVDDFREDLGGGSR